jgi:hypothetical protein
LNWRINKDYGHLCHSMNSVSCRPDRAGKMPMTLH